jgi:hypothetical protein
MRPTPEDIQILNRPLRRITLAVTLALALAACDPGIKGVRVTNDGTSATTSKTPVPITDFTADQIRAAISGKTFQYTRADGNGFVTYNADGTFSFQDDAKGGGVGKWTANGTQYCESWGKSLPECGVFKNTGDAFFASSSRLVEMKT